MATIEYKLAENPLNPTTRHSVTIPEVAKTEADKLLCMAGAAKLGAEMKLDSPYLGNPGILSALFDYKEGTVELAQAQDVVVLDIAEAISSEDPQFEELRADIVDKTRIARGQYGGFSP